MIHILTEDSTDGLRLCQQIKSIYFDDKFDNIEIRSIMGIWNLKSKLENELKCIDKDDIILLVYDDIRDNPIIDRFITEAVDWLEASDNYNRVFWISTKAFEIELLLLDGIEFFGNMKNYKIYFDALREKYYETFDLLDLTKLSKENSIYDNIYVNEKRKKQRQNIYRNLSESDFEKAITIETISKNILNKVFENISVDRPMNGCWLNNCCIRRNHCQNEYFDVEKLIEEHGKQGMYKTRWIILCSSYRKVVEKVYQLNGIEPFDDEIDIYDMLDNHEEENGC